MNFRFEVLLENERAISQFSDKRGHSLIEPWREAGAYEMTIIISITNVTDHRWLSFPRGHLILTTFLSVKEIKTSLGG